jgi:hypothetical protein
VIVVVIEILIVIVIEPLRRNCHKLWNVGWLSPGMTENNQGTVKICVRVSQRGEQGSERNLSVQKVVVLKKKVGGEEMVSGR